MSLYWWILIAIGTFVVFSLIYASVMTFATIRKNSKGHIGSRTYRSLEDQFELILPNGWRQKGSRIVDNPQRIRYEFYGPDGKIRFAIGPISEPPLEDYKNIIRRIAAKHGHRIIEIGEIEIAGKIHPTMLVDVPFGPFPSMRLKNYFLIFNGIEYVITASFIADEIIKTFRPLSSFEDSTTTSSTTPLSLDEPENARSKALDLMNRGRFADAENLITNIINRMPPYDRSNKSEARQRFNLLVLQADIIKKWKEDRERELELLNECAEIAERHDPLFPPPSAGPDFLTNGLYIMNKNRAAAAVALGQYDMAEEAITKALEAAVNDVYKGKCLGQKLWIILEHFALSNTSPPDKARQKEAWDTIKSFKHLNNKDNTSKIIQSHIELGRGILYLYQNDQTKAYAAYRKAVYLNSTSANRYRQIFEDPNVSVSEINEFIINTNIKKEQSKAEHKQLSPLPQWTFQYSTPPPPKKTSA